MLLNSTFVKATYTYISIQFYSRGLGLHSPTQLKSSKSASGSGPNFRSSVYFPAWKGKVVFKLLRIKLLFIQWLFNVMRDMTYMHIEQCGSFSILPVPHPELYQLPSTPIDSKRNLGPGKKHIY